MRRIVAAFLAVAALVVVGPLPAHADAGSRVLIVGDSTTQGRDGDWTWRYFAWQALTATRSDVDFVGPRRGTYTDADTWGGSYADPDFDQDHAARWGQAMWQPLDAPDERSPSMRSLVAGQQADIVVEALGINDLAWARFSAEQVAEQVRRLVADARAANPSVEVVIGGVPQVWIGDARAFNELLPTLAADLSTDDSRVVAATVPEFVEGQDTWDFAHPSRAGEVKLGAAYAAAIASVLPGATDVSTPVPATPPAAPATPPATPAAPPTTPPAAVPVAPTPAPGAAPPLPPRHVSARRTGARVVVTWRKAARADAYRVRCGATSTRVDSARAVLRSAARSCSVRSSGAGGASAWRTVRVRPM